MGCCASNALGDITDPERISSQPSSKNILSLDIDDSTASSIETLISEISNNPMLLPNCINGALLWNIGILIGKSIASNSASESCNALTSLIQTNLDNQLENKSIQLNSAYIYMFSEIVFRSNKEQYKQYCELIFNDCCSGLTNESLAKNGKLYLKSILAWNFKGESKYFIDLKKLSQQQLTELSQLLLSEYEELRSKNDDVLQIQIDDNIKYNHGNFELNPQFIRKNIIGLSDDLLSWYGTGFFVDKEKEIYIIKQYQDLNFINANIMEWLDTMRNAEGMLEPSIVLRDILWRMSMRFDDEFQVQMEQAFDENRNKLSLEIRNDDEDIGYRKAPVKTKSRVWSKVFRDYADKHEFPDAYFMVQDWIRCALVCQTSDELVSLYKLICSDKYFGGQIIRVKNGFHKDAHAEFGYRVLMINAIYQNMIVEVQLMLLPFLKVRKKMHLHYKIVRAEKSNDLAQDFSSING